MENPLTSAFIVKSFARPGFLAGREYSRGLPDRDRDGRFSRLSCAIARMTTAHRHRPSRRIDDFFDIFRRNGDSTDGRAQPLGSVDRCHARHRQRRDDPLRRGHRPLYSRLLLGERYARLSDQLHHRTQPPH